MFWGIILKPGQEYPQIVAKPFKITMAVLADGQQLEEDSKAESSRVKLDYNNQTYFICRLHPSKSPQVALNLEFSAGSEIKFYVVGPYEVHLSGFTKEILYRRTPSVSEDSDPRSLSGFDQVFKCRIHSESDDTTHIPGPTIVVPVTDAFDATILREKPTSSVSKSRKRTSVSDSALEAKFGKIMIEREEERLNSCTPEIIECKNENSRQHSATETNSNTHSEGSETGNVFLDPSSSPDVIRSQTSKSSASSDLEEILCTNLRPNSHSLPSSPNPANNSLLAKITSLHNNTEDVHARKYQLEPPQVTFPQTVFIATSPFHVFSPALGKANLAVKPISVATSNSIAESVYTNTKPHAASAPCTIAPHSGIPDNHPFLALALEHCSRSSEKRTDNKTLVEDINFGQGKRAQKGQRVFVRYIGVVVQLKKVIDSNLNAKMPFSFRLGMGEVIHGWDAGLEDMRVGGTRKIVIPSSNIYGNKSCHPDIPTDTDMIFIVKLVGLN